ncbi:hypothetical protein HYH03_017263 [Edaphochlamys debaryana]|uniref:Uncharacterized protein n=1 Tax=Edaphochlamys debaryana TaxID=47281 RepID=A0A836BP20_9CHLO|nr:hypothetical protein HYH03_017263 [Edaphochlamys debaryana]|eukprot:KAG2483866.1 hypothetical protein HYH03_017263 [Edaphochlamys debaryana]
MSQPRDSVCGRRALGVAVLLVALACSPIGAAGARRGVGAAAFKQQQSSDIALGDEGFSGYFGRKLQQSCQYNCTKLNSCMSNTCSYYNSTHIYVLVSVGSCKPGNVSWFCCRQAAPICSLDTSSCPGNVAGNTCNDLTTVGYFIQIGPPASSATQPSPTASPTSAAQPPASSAAQPPASSAAQPPASPASPATQPPASTATQPPASTAAQPPASSAAQPPAASAAQPPAAPAAQPPAASAAQPSPSSTPASSP